MGLILVDSSVWIDQLAGRLTIQTALLDALRTNNRIGAADLVVAEVLQGARSDRAFRYAAHRFNLCEPVIVGSMEVATAAATYYRHLRTLGITPRKTIDTLIATRCILGRIPLLYSDRDFDPFVEHLGLISAMSLPGAH